jgi:hypothetical protein
VGRVYRFQVTAAGRVAGLAPVPGPRFPANYVGVMAVSPDGSQLALSMGSYVLSHESPSPERIVVVNTRTGSTATFAGGRAPHGQNPRSVRILQLSWTANGRELVYLARWTCHSASATQVCGNAGPLGGYEQVRTLNPARQGGRLSSGRLLASAPDGAIGAAVISPDGRTLAEVQVITLFAWKGRSRTEFLIAKVDARTGRRLRILGQLRTGSREMVRSFAPSPSGQYLIVVNGTRTGTINGWIGHGRLHRLPPAGVRVSSETW